VTVKVSSVSRRAKAGERAIGDFNRDGNPDIAFPNSATNNVSILLGDGTGGFATAVNYPLSGSGTVLAAGDFNGDGKLDLFCTVANSPSGHGAQILFGNGDGTFQPAVDVTNVPISPFGGISVADFDNNGTTDVALQIGSGTLIFLGNGNGTFTMGTTLPSAGNTAAVGDFRGIGRADLAAGGSMAQMFLNNGGGTATFTEVTATSFPDVFNNPATFTFSGDLTGNGHESIVTGGGTDDLHVILSNGDGTFQPPVQFGAAAKPNAFATGDFNGDGSPDLIFNGSHTPNGFGLAGANVLYNNGNGTFSSSVQVFGNCLGTTDIVVADFNHDGIADFATADQFAGVCVWLGSANPALAPTNVASVDVTVPYNAAGESFSMSATVTSAGGPVNGGLVNFVVPYYNGYANYYVTASLAASGAQPVHIIVTGIPTTTTASAASVSFSGSPQNVTLTATVTSAATVNTGTVTFFVTGIGSVTGSVTNGVASAVLSIPGGTAMGSYAINAIYTPVSPLGGSNDNTKALTITGTSTTTTASPASAFFNAAQQTVTLNAAVTSSNGVVNAGIVTFTVTGVGAATSGTVVNGAASATLTIPAGQAAASYPIQATYSGTANLSASSDNSKSLIISLPAPTTTIASAATILFSPSAQSVTLNVQVTSVSGLVNGGTVAFTVTGLGTVTSGSVANGFASATLNIPAGQAAGSYAINAVYSGSVGFAGSSDNSQGVTISKGATTTTASAASANFSSLPQTVTLHATVTSPIGPVNSGTITFTVPGVGTATSGTVSNGAASAVLTIPAGQAAASYSIQAAYSGATNLNASSDNTKSLVIAAPAGTTTTAAAAATATFNSATQTVTLNAIVTSTAGAVNGGTVKFTVTYGPFGIIIGTATSGPVANGAATATLVVPGGQAAGTHAIKAVLLRQWNADRQQ